MLLFLDTETTGVPEFYNLPYSKIENWPRLVQVAWILCNDKGETVFQNENIIRPEGFVIPEHASKVHGITTEKAMEVGIELKWVMERLKTSIHVSDVVVGHNISFDYNIVGAEFLRCGLGDVMKDVKTFCTMKSTTEFCQLPGKRGYKWPQLSELFQKTFDKEMGEAHTALVDIQNTASVFFELQRRGVIKL